MRTRTASPPARNSARASIRAASGLNPFSGIGDAFARHGSAPGTRVGRDAGEFGFLERIALRGKALVELRQRNEYEGALVQMRVRHVQAGLVDCAVVVRQQIEIDDARTPPFALGSSQPALDRRESVEQLARGMLRFERDDAVEKPRLIGLTPRRSAIE